MGRMWRGGYRRFHPIGDRMGNEMVGAFDVGQPICDLDMEYGIYKVPAKESHTVQDLSGAVAGLEG